MTQPELEKYADVPLSRGSFLRGAGVTFLAGVTALMLPATASAAPRPARSTAKQQPDLCYENCVPTNCGNTLCAGNAHIFHCTGCFDSTMCIPDRTCNSFCYQTQPC